MGVEAAPGGVLYVLAWLLLVASQLTYIEIDIYIRYGICHPPP